MLQAAQTPSREKEGSWGSRRLCYVLGILMGLWPFILTTTLCMMLGITSPSYSWRSGSRESRVSDSAALSWLSDRAGTCTQACSNPGACGRKLRTCRANTERGHLGVFIIVSSPFLSLPPPSLWKTGIQFSCPLFGPPVAFLVILHYSPSLEDLWFSLFAFASAIKLSSTLTAGTVLFIFAPLQVSTMPGAL